MPCEKSKIGSIRVNVVWIIVRWNESTSFQPTNPFLPITSSKTHFPRRRNSSQNSVLPLLKFCKQPFGVCMTLGSISKKEGLDFHASKSLDKSSPCCFLSSKLTQLLDGKSTFPKLGKCPSTCIDLSQRVLWSSRHGY